MIVLSFEYTKIGYIDSNIDKLINTEIITIRESYIDIEIPFESMGQISKLKAFVTTNVPFLSNNEISNEMCNLNEIIYFHMTFTQYLSIVPFDCISENWNQLTYMRLEFFPLMQDINPNFWNLPKLQTAILDSCDFQKKYFTFDTFNGFSKQLDTVSLSATDDLCNNGTIIIDNIKYHGFGYLANKNFTYNDVNNDQSGLLNFIQTFDPCSYPCDSTDWVCVCIYYIYILFLYIKKYTT